MKIWNEGYSYRWLTAHAFAVANKNHRCTNEQECKEDLAMLGMWPISDDVAKYFDEEFRRSAR